MVHRRTAWLTAMLLALALALVTSAPAGAGPGAQAGTASLVLLRPGNGGAELLAASPGGGRPRQLATLDGVAGTERYVPPLCAGAPPQSVVCWRGRQIVVYDLVAGTNAVVTEATAAPGDRVNWRVYPGAEGTVWVREVLPDPQNPDTPQGKFRLGRVSTGASPSYQLVATGEHLSLGAGLSVIGDSPARNRVYLRLPSGDIGVPGIRVLDRTTGAEIATYPPKPAGADFGPGMGVVPVSVSPDGRWALSGPEPSDAAIWVYDLDNFPAKPAAAVAPVKQSLSGILWRQDGRALVSLSTYSLLTGPPADNQLATTLWTFNPADLSFQPGPTLSGNNYPEALSPDEAWLALRTSDPGGISLLNLAGGDPVKVGEDRDLVLGWLQTP